MRDAKVGELTLECRCPEAEELAKKARAASEHLQAAIDILDGIGYVELNVEVTASGKSSRSGGSSSIPDGE